MSASSLPSRSFLSIGEVLAQLRPDFPDVTISKIRFLESEGLVEPERTPSGYRKFSHDDVQRLRYVLTAQRDHYLPLRVIKEHLEALDRGLEPPTEAGGGPRVPHGARRDRRAARPGGVRPGLRRGAAVPQGAARGRRPRRGRARPSSSSTAWSPRARAASTTTATSLVIAQTVAEMARFGIEPRHLRSFKAAADREVGLVEQVVTPLVRQRNPEARARAEEVVRELAALSVRLHAAW